MATKTDIANLAAALIGGETRITSLDEDRSLARTLKAVWDIERRATIRDGAFNFAIKRFELAAELIEGGVPYPWEHSFRLPAEALRLLEVLSTSDYQLEGKWILCNGIGPLYVRCVIDVEAAELWDDSFAEAFACRLAWKVGTRVAGSSYDAREGWAQYQSAIGRAKVLDGAENPPIGRAEPDWIEARVASALTGNPARWG